jgi:hypothetical protein
MHDGGGMAWVDLVALALTVPASLIVMRACWRARSTSRQKENE